MRKVSIVVEQHFVVPKDIKQYWLELHNLASIMPQGGVEAA
jgi:hypothetical protein